MEDYETLKILSSANGICGKKRVKKLLCTKYFALESKKIKGRKGKFYPGFQFADDTPSSGQSIGLDFLDSDLKVPDFDFQGFFNRFYLHNAFLFFNQQVLYGFKLNDGAVVSFVRHLNSKRSKFQKIMIWNSCI